MAESGLVATLIRLGGTGAKFALTLFTIADSLGSSGKETTALATEIAHFSQSLGSLSRSLERRSDEQEYLKELAAVVIKASDSLLDDLRGIFEHLLPSDKTTLESYSNRVKEILQSPRAKATRHAAVAFKSSLLLLGAASDSAEAKYRHAPGSIVNLLDFQVEALQRAIENASSDLRDGTSAEKTDGPPLSSINEERAINGETNPEIVSSKHTNGINGNIIDESSGPSKQQESALEEIGAALSRADSVRGRPVKKGKSAKRESTVIELSSSPKQTVELILQVDQMVLDLTQRVLDYSDPEAEWSWETSSAALKGKGHDANIATKGLKASKLPVTDIGPLPISGIYDIPFSKPEPRLSKSLLHKDFVGAEAASPTTDVGPGLSEDRLAQLEQSVADMLHDSKRKSFKKSSSKKTKVDSDAEEEEPIILKDAVGRKFTFPYEICRKWKGVEQLLNQAFLHVDVIGQHVHDGHYDLIGPSGDIVLPQLWEMMVKPGWRVTMHMWPIPEPPKKLKAPPPMVSNPFGPPPAIGSGLGPGLGAGFGGMGGPPPPPGVGASMNLPPPGGPSHIPPLIPRSVRTISSIESRRKKGKSWLKLPKRIFSRSSRRSTASSGDSYYSRPIRRKKT